jgi:uncharacterized surface protein with fasciclin (FAS1) repeats
MTKLLTQDWILHLQNLLLFHATGSGALLSTNLTDGMEIAMLNGENVTVDIETIVNTTSYFIQEAELIAVDLVAANGVVHKIDSVLLPAFIGIDVLDLLDAADELSILADLVRRAGLEDTIRTGIVTLLAPVNAAFDALPKEAVDFLLDPVNMDLLLGVLLYHAVDHVVPSGLLETGSTLTSLLGPKVNVTVNDGGVFFNADSPVLQADRLARNGIVHVVGKVLIPPPPKIEPNAVAVAAASEVVESATKPVAEGAPQEKQGQNLEQNSIDHIVDDLLSKLGPV